LQEWREAAAMVVLLHESGPLCSLLVVMAASCFLQVLFLV